jgi:hypothetical protein
MCELVLTGSGWSQQSGFCEQGIKPQVSIQHGTFLTSERLSASQEGIWSMDLVGRRVRSISLFKHRDKR